MYIAPNVGGGYTPMTLYLQLRHRLILSLRMSRLMYIAPNVGGGLPRYKPGTSFTFLTGDMVYRLIRMIRR